QPHVGWALMGPPAPLVSKSSVDWFWSRPKVVALALLFAGCSADELSSSSVTDGDAGGSDGPFPQCGPDALAMGEWISPDEQSSYEAESFVAVAPNGAAAFAWIAKGCDGRTRIGYRSGSAPSALLGPISYVESPRGQEASDPALAFDAAGGKHLIF